MSDDRTNTFHLGPWRVEPDRNALVGADEEIHLENRVMQTLVFLANHPGEVIARNQFFDSVWRGRVVNEEALSRAISMLRSALGDSPQNPRFIQTIPGVGYRLIAAVRREQAPRGAVPAPVVVAPAEGEPRGRPGLLRRLVNPGLIASVLVAAGYLALERLILDTGETVRPGTESAVSRDPSVAVLPFVNISADPDQDFFADGMTEEILNLLAAVPDLRVTARTSSFFFKGRNLPISQIAESLRVRHVLEGSVRRSGQRVRITAQLIDARTDTHLWSQTYDVPLRDVLDVQDTVASAIARALVDSFDGLHPRAASHTDSLAAFEAYRSGRLLWWQRTPRDLEAAIDLFETAIAADAGFAPAYAAIADSWVLLVLYGSTQILDGVNNARPMIEAALALDPQLAEAHAALGLSQLVIGEKHDAERNLRHAIDLDADYIPASIWLAALLSDLGRVPEEGAVLQAALARDPLNTLLTGAYANNLHLRGETASAREMIEGILRLQPDSPALQVRLSEIEREAGRLVEAWKAAHTAYVIAPDNTVAVIALAEVWRSLGELLDAEAILTLALEQAPRNVNIKLQYIEVLVRQGRIEDAFAVRDGMFPDDISWIPEANQRTFHQVSGMLHLAGGSLARARDHLDQGLNPAEPLLYDDNQLTFLTVLARLATELGEMEIAEQRLRTAERVVGHARVNGIENASLYYTAACIFAMRKDPQRALQSLRQAYAKGWRDRWLLENDFRLDGLRAEPAFGTLEQELSDSVAAAQAAIRGELAGAVAESSPPEDTAPSTVD